ncbi:MAG: hypothetical protein JNG84_12560 [Archangium sp.]|nr:hypothetical protein [Archangium sp.]
MKKQLKCLVAAAALATALTGCAGPRIVSSMHTTRDGKFRLLFYRNAGMGATEQGIVDCKTQSNGSISDCQPVKVTFQED